MTSRERELLEILAQRLRLLAVTQIARVWFHGSRTAERQAMKLAQRLSAAGWLYVEKMFARPIVPPTTPLVTWQHASPPADFRAVARALHTRARPAPALSSVHLIVAIPGPFDCWLAVSRGQLAVHVAVDIAEVERTPAFAVELEVAFFLFVNEVLLPLLHRHDPPAAIEGA